MRVLIVAKTRRGSGACVGGITQDGTSVRLVAADGRGDDRAGLEYQVGEVWEIDSSPDPRVIPPHVENILVHVACRLDRAPNTEELIRRFMPPVEGGPDRLFGGLLYYRCSGALFIAPDTGPPSFSTQFWVSNRPLRLDREGKRIHYCYPKLDGRRLLTFVGFQEPLPEIPAGTLLRVSLAHWWRPKNEPKQELRCHVQLSGWFPHAASPACRPRKVVQAARAEPVPASVGETDISMARRILKQAFGFSDFLPLQAEIIGRVLRAQDTLAVMPTGGGKSVCYQLPALLLGGLTVVVSPLIALMQDQVSQLRELAIPAAFLNSTLAHLDYVKVAHRVRSGEVRILYVAPETLLRPETLLLLEDSHLACLAVDEAHCISEWGHDFRPEYREIQAVRKRFPQAVCVALTATATPRVREDIRGLLELDESGEFVASFDRPNLLLTAQPRGRGLDQVFAFLLRHRGQSGIVYCSTRKRVDELSTELRAHGCPALPYHAGLADEVRGENQDRFIRDDAMIMVATVAFGMGINKSNVRFVLHVNLPRDIESYYQEVGRAGRDGLPAECLLLHSRADALTIQHFIGLGSPSERPGRQARLDTMIRYAETRECRRRLLLGYFGETASASCGHCDNCSAALPDTAVIGVAHAARGVLSRVRSTGEGFDRRESGAVTVGATKVIPSEPDPELFESLRKLRRQLADQAKVPAYIIFSDRALTEMATRLPRTPDQFLAINGVGEVKLARYGKAFLDSIRLSLQGQDGLD